jgi:hypothetical protein
LEQFLSQCHTAGHFLLRVSSTIMTSLSVVTRLTTVSEARRVIGQFTGLATSLESDKEIEILRSQDTRLNQVIEAGSRLAGRRDVR